MRKQNKVFCGLVGYVSYLDPGPQVILRPSPLEWESCTSGRSLESRNKMSWVGHVARMEGGRTAFKI